MRSLLFLLLLLTTQHLLSQKVDSLKQSTETTPKKKEDKLLLSLYERVIWDVNGNVRYDENIVSNLKLNDWLRAEGGFRLGHRPQKFDSYYHYKLELQTKSFWKTARIFIRLSNDVNQSAPKYARSYYIAVTELRRPLSKSFSVLAAFGHVIATQRDNLQDGTPSFSGTKTDYNAYKVGLRYSLRDKGFVEAMCGNYDVFNPYQPSNSFLQTHFEYELSKRVLWTSNLRYQFDSRLDQPLGYFIIAGVRIRY